MALSHIGWTENKIPVRSVSCRGNVELHTSTLMNIFGRATLIQLSKTELIIKVVGGPVPVTYTSPHNTPPRYTKAAGFHTISLNDKDTSYIPVYPLTVRTALECYLVRLTRPLGGGSKVLGKSGVIKKKPDLTHVNVVLESKRECGDKINSKFLDNTA